jgi:hypothetical protein
MKIAGEYNLKLEELCAKFFKELDEVLGPYMAAIL